MTITVSTSDPRSVKALAILADSGQWLKLRTRDGRKFYGVRSQSSPETVYSVDCHGCDCPDRVGRLERSGSSEPCKHQLAVMLHCARVNGRKAQLEAARKRRVAPAATTYAEVYGSDRGHDAATCRLTVCPDC